MHARDQREKAEKFQKFYPAIKLEAQVIQGREAGVRIPEEMKNGIYSFDVFSSGSTTSAQLLIPMGGIFADLRPALVLPEITNDANWIGGFDAWWIDDESKKFQYNHWGGVSTSGTFWVNRQKLPEARFNKVDDLFKPELKGKWCSDDTRSPGRADSLMGQLLITRGSDFVRRLLKETNPTISRDYRKMGEDLIRGDFLACLGADINPFQREGVGLHVQQLDFQYGAIAPEFAGKIKITCCRQGVTKQSIDDFLGGAGATEAHSLLTNAPHLNAAKVYLNWLLSKEGQGVWALPTDESCSMRADLKAGCKFPLPEEGKAYVALHRTSNVWVRQAAQQIAREVFGR
jgi:ABC-type Fe3+ transport system substrate-binding protein